MSEPARPSRRRLLAGLAALAIARPAVAISVAETCGRPGAGGLSAVACRRGIWFGSAVASSDLADPAYAALVAAQCALLTPTWEMKWKPLRPGPDSFDFAACDRLAGFARQHGMALRGHTLIWHMEMPVWLLQSLSPASWEGLLERHMQTVIGRYRRLVSSWDVVNEAVEPEHGRDDGLRDSPWLRVAGPDYVVAAYKLAGRFAPEARLVYNDYGCEHEAEWTRRRRRAVLRLLERLRKADAPVHALGLQSHLRVGDAFDAAAFGRFLGEVRDLGLVPMVTEFDLRADRVRGADEKDRKTAALAKAYLDTVLAAGCDTVVCWGLSDDKSWRAAEEPDDRPLPFDRQLAAKPLYQALEDALSRSAS